MRLKIKKLLFNLTNNARMSTKELAKKTKSSQQSCSYLVGQYRKRNLIQDFLTIVDPVKLGFLNIIVGFDFMPMEAKERRSVINELARHPNIVFLEENNVGVDLLVEYCVQNMSAFNKQHSEIVGRFPDLRARFIFPVLVKHTYAKNYLMRKGEDIDMVLSGDRDPVTLGPNEIAVLRGMVRGPRSSMSAIASQAGLSVKSVSRVKQSLERKQVIKGYTCTLNHGRFEILRHHVLFKFTNEGVGFMNSFVQYARQHKNIVRLVKLLGNYQVLITIEELKSAEVVQDIRARYPTDDYLVIRSTRLIKRAHLPPDGLAEG